MTRLCHLFLIALLALTPSNLGAQLQEPAPLTQVEQLQLQVIQLQAELVKAKQDWTDLLKSFGQCMQANLDHTKGLPTASLQSWTQQVEQSRPGFKWDGTKFVPNGSK